MYSDGQESFATVHEPKDSPDGGAPYLDAGEALTIDFLKQLAKGLGRSVPREILPSNVLARTPDILVWWTRQQRRVMFFSDSSDGRTLNGKVFPQPPLVFKVCGSELSVRALAENKRPQTGHAADVCTLLELRRGRPGVPRQYAGTGETVPRSDEGVGKGVLRKRIHPCRYRRAADGAPRGFPGIVAGPGGERGRIPWRVSGQERRFAR